MTRDSSVGRAEDCSCLYLISCHRFKSGSRDLFADTLAQSKLCTMYCVKRTLCRYLICVVRVRFWYDLTTVSHFHLDHKYNNIIHFICVKIPCTCEKNYLRWSHPLIIGGKTTLHIICHRQLAISAKLCHKICATSAYIFSCAIKSKDLPFSS